MTIAIKHGDCRDLLRTLPDASVHCVVTSPPYWGLRDYGVDGQIGLEPDFSAYVAAMVAVFRDVRRVLRDDGTLWLNLGDSYSSGGRATWCSGTSGNKGQDVLDDMPRPSQPNGLKPKDLIGIPWRVAFALQADGWYLRQDIIWSKPNPMPESVTDRCTKAHEYLFLLSKRERYYYDAEAIAEDATARLQQRLTLPTEHPKAQLYGGQNFVDGGISTTRNKRSVWEVTTQPFSEAHFATFPPALIEPCIKAGTSERGCCGKCGAPWTRQIERGHDDRVPYVTEGAGSKANGAGRNDGSGLRKVLREDGRGGDLARMTTATIGWSPSCACAAAVVPCTVLDPFGGAGTTGLVADRLQRNAILIELNPTYAAMSEHRITDDAPLFAHFEDISTDE